MNAGTQQRRICPDRQKTKIIATLGHPPKTHKQGIRDLNRQDVRNPTVKTVIDVFFEQSVDIIRINLAHIEKQDLEARFRAIKQAIVAAEKDTKWKIGVLVDLPGPKIRFQSDGWLVPTQTLQVALDKRSEELVKVPARAKRPTTTWPEPPLTSTACLLVGEEPFAEVAGAATDDMLRGLAQKVAAGNRPLAFIGDSEATLEVQSTSGRLVTCNVIDVKANDRVIRDRKGFTIRGIPTPIAAFTEEDEDKLSELLRVDRLDGSPIVSYIGISFCQTREDARRVLYHVINEMRREHADKNALAELLSKAPLLIAKIETGKGVENIEEILDFADGAMIARGDLALNINIEDLPKRSKEIIEYCRLRGKPVITATQMLESMKTNIECTRPEAVGVFQAVADGSDALLLSDETSAGMYPAQTIRKMQALANQAEVPLANEESEDARIEDLFKRVREVDKRVEQFRRRWDDIVNKHEGLRRAGSIDESEAEFVRDFARIKQEQLRGQESTDRITHAACLMSVEKRVRVIVAPTTSGRTARMLVRFQPGVWIHAQPIDDFVGRKLRIDRGVTVGRPIPVEAGSMDPSSLMIRSREAIESAGELTGEAAIFVCGTPLGRVGTTNLIQRWDPIQKK